MSGKELKMNTLFPIQPNFRIVALRELDGYAESDHLKNFVQLVKANEAMYPGIKKWLSSKVIPGLKSSERVAYIGYEGETPVVSAVVKRGQRAKLCHLRIHEDFRDLDLGQVFFCQMINAIRQSAKEVHFTLPESLWLEKREFFNSFGFMDATKSKRQYRAGEAELSCSAPFSDAWSATLAKLPDLMGKFSIGGYAIDNRVLISIRPRYAERILNGQKMIEIRRKFSKKWTGHRVSLYASHPIGALVGEATIDGIMEATPEQVWMHFESDIGCTKEEFDTYTESADKIYAIQLKIGRAHV